MAETRYIRVRYVKSAIGYNKKQKATIASLGLRRLGQETIIPVNGATLGMCKAVEHLVSWDEVDPSEVPAKG